MMHPDNKAGWKSEREKEKDRDREYDKQLEQRVESETYCEEAVEGTCKSYESLTSVNGSSCVYWHKGKCLQDDDYD